MTPSADLRARVLAAAAASRAPTRKDGRNRAIVALVASVVVAALVFALAGGFEHSAGRPRELTFALAGGWGLVATAVSWLVVARGGSTLARSPRLLLAVALASPLLCLIWMHAFAGHYDEPFARMGYRCLAYTLVIGTLPLAAFLGLRRATEPRRPSALGAAAGAMSGAWAGVVIDLWCPLTNTAHAIVGHALPLAALVALGALLGRRALGVRAR